MKKYFYAKIRSDLVSDKLYDMKDGSYGDVVNKTMMKHLGEIHKFYFDGYKYRSNEIDYNWTDEMFEYKIGVKYA